MCLIKCLMALHNLKTRMMLGILLTCVLLVNICEGNKYKSNRPPYEDFLNYGIKKLKPIQNRGLENEIIKSKVDVLGDVLKGHVDRLRKIPGQTVELVFLVDSSASVGAENFFNELKFVKKLLADFTVSYNQTRVAVVTFSSKAKVIRHIDHVTQASPMNNKCSLLERELPRIPYSGGGTFTLGALLEAQSVLAISRTDAIKAVFLVTDGYSNGGDPRPAAEFLKSRGVIMFTFGIRNGNVKELYDMASEPKEEHSYILDSFEEFEALARRALHEDLHNGIMIGLDSAACTTLCEKRDDCCDSYARCTCGTHTGHYACTCRLGYYGTGLKGDCKPCPVGTYRSEEGPSDINSCQACPDPNMLSSLGSTSPYQCYCNRGYTQYGLKCKRMQCPILSPPANGYFVRGTCERVVNAACGMRCRTGYTLMGSSIRLCREDGTWSGGDGTCVVKTCPKLKTPINGNMICSSETGSIDTQCHFMCIPGHQLVGSRMRTCLPVAMWDGIRAYCKPIFCLPVPPLKNGFVKSRSCTLGKIRYGTICEFGCERGYQLVGSLKTKCFDHGVWSEGQQKARCIDVDPPVIRCPKNVHANTEQNENYAIVTWDEPYVKDSSNSPVYLATMPATKQPMRMKIGSHNIIYIAKDEWDNQNRCIFTITVKDNEPPRIDSCMSPPTFLSRDEIVDVYWEEPLFSDNSGTDVQILRSKDPGPFPQGETLVEYHAKDIYGNKASCNITINVQHHACDLPLDPINGASNCTEDPGAVHCTLTCTDGYAFAMRPSQDYFCSYDGIWQPDSNPLPFPDCSLSSLSNTISQSGEIAMDNGGSVCDDIFFMGQVENTMQQRLEDALSNVCADDFLCEISTVEAVCEGILADAEEEFNSIFSKRKKRDLGTDEEFFRQYWPGEDAQGWIYWKRGVTHSNVKSRRSKRSFESHYSIKDNVRVKRQFGFPTSIFGSKKNTSSTSMSKNKANFMGILTGLIIKNLGRDIGMTRFSSFLSGQGDQKIDNYAFSDFLGAFAKEFGEEKAMDLKLLTQAQLGQSENITEDVEFLELLHQSSVNKHSGQIQMMNDASAPIALFRGSKKGRFMKTKKKKMKFQFKVKGRGKGHKAMKYMNSVVDKLLKSAEEGLFDIQIGENQLKVAALRIAEDPEFLCDAGSVLQENLCVKCSVGTFFNVIAKECQSCPTGSYQPKEGQVSCIVCPENTSTKHGQSRSGYECKAMCLPGSYSDDTLEPCITCPLGEFLDKYASSSCVSCPYGTTTWRRGAWTIEECGPVCSSGRVSETGLEPCLPCPRNYFQEEEGQKTCFKCPGNSTTNVNGSISMANCMGMTHDTQAAYTNLEILHFNECFSSPCKHNGSCQIEDSGFICNCPKGFNGQLCEYEINECQSNPCLNNATCEDLIGDYKCHCSPGFLGVTCEEDINECKSNPCENKSFCVDLIDSFKCICEPGYTGDLCNINIDECSNAPCSNFSTCKDGISDYTCECQPGYSGRHCTTDIDECDLLPCFHGTCKDLINDFECICNDGYEGKKCEMEKDDCLSSPCQNNATCVDWLHAFSCRCTPGFGGKHCEDRLSTDFTLEFPSSGKINYAMVDNFSRELSSMTVCFWMRTTDRENYGTPFSYATDSHDNALTLTDYNGFVLYINGEMKITDVSATDGQWHMICVVWSNSKGTWAIFKDGNKEDSGTNISKGKTISADGVLVLGQEQDQMGGKYSAPESFIGELSLFNIWGRDFDENSVKELFSECERYDGDIRSWADFQKGIMGNIKLKTSTFCKGCGIPIPPVHGLIAKGGSDAGSTIKIECNEGYKLFFGDDQRTCLIDGVWSGMQPECQPVSCGFPGYLSNGEVIGNYYYFGETVKYKCNNGFIIFGNKTRKCKADGKWDGESAVCGVIKCPDPSVIHNGKLMSHLGSYLPTNEALYSCEEGYQMDGPPHRTCGKDGTWKGKSSTCQPEACEKFPNIQHSLEPETAVSRGGSVIIECQKNFKIEKSAELFCDQNGKWKKPFPKCIRKKCEKPPFVENGNVQIRVSSKGKQAKYSCLPEFVLKGNSILTCQKNGEWDLPFSKCVLQGCPEPELPEYTVLHKYMNNWSIGDIATYECITGYILVGNSKILCIEGYKEGYWEGSTPQCIEIECSAVKPIKDGSFTIKKPTIKGNVIHFPQVELLRFRREASLYDSAIPYGDLQFTRPQRGFNDEQTPNGDLQFAKPHGGFDNKQAFDDRFELGQSQERFDDEQTPTGDIEFARPHGGFDDEQAPVGSFEQRQSQERLDEFAKPHQGFDYEQSPNGEFEFEQPQRGFGGQKPDGDVGFAKPPTGFNYGQSPDGEIEFGQSQGGFDIEQLPDEELKSGQFADEFDEFSQTDDDYDFFEFDYSQKPAEPIIDSYEFGTTIEYTCRTGYKLIGANSLMCGELGDWDLPQPICSEQHCPDLSLVDNGYMSYFGSGATSRVEFHCNDGFQLEGNSELYCQIDRNWSGVVPNCKQMNCDAPFELENGTVIFDSTAFGSVANYECFQGFVLEGSFERVCGHSGAWNGSMPRCIAIVCKTPSVIDKGYIYYEGNLNAGSQVEYGCDDCYMLNGTLKRECQLDETWSLDEPFCERIYCTDISSELENGKVIGGDNSCGSMIEYECNPGFNLKGKKKVYCTTNGKWTSVTPMCQKVSCPIIDKLYNGLVIGKSYKFMDEVKFKCKTGYDLVGDSLLTCSEEKTWSGTFPTCQIKYCKKPKGPSNGRVRVSGLFYESNVKVVCDPGFKIDGDSMLKCNADGKWNKKMPFCAPIVCPRAPISDNAFYNSTEVYFESFTQLHYLCDSGYKSSAETNFMTCSSIGQWVGNVIECSPVDCGNPGYFFNGEVDGTKFTFGNILDFDCNEGFELIGMKKAVCQSSGDWTAIPSCQKIRCGPLEAINNGIVNSDYHEGDFGSTIHYKCNEGHILIGLSNRTCGENSEWSGNAPECHPVLCPEPTEIVNIKMEGNIYEFNHSIYFDCYEGYTLVGSSKLTCLSNGKWTSQFPMCKMIICTQPVDIHFAKWKTIKVSKAKLGTKSSKSRIGKIKKTSKLTVLLTDIQEEILYRFGHTILYKCDKGHFKTTTGLLECTSDGWNSLPPQCNPITCPLPIPIQNGKVIWNEVTFGAVLSYECYEGYEIFGAEKRICQANKDWADIEPYCRSKECPIPSQIDHGKTMYNNVYYNSIVTYACSPGFRLEGISSRICQSNEQWSKERPVCVEIFCDEPEEVPYAISEIGHLKVGGSIRYSCMEGYKLQGLSTINCQTDGTWDSSLPKCIQVDCGAPVTSFHLSYSGTSTIYASKIHYKCSRGYNLEGTDWNQCSQSGIWINDAPRCILITCSPPITPEHAILKTEIEELQVIEETQTLQLVTKSKGTNQKRAKTKSSKIKVSKVDDELVYDCLDGWKPIGETSLRCTQAGYWSSTPPRCQRISCGAPEIPHYGKYVGMNYLFKDLIEFTCEEGYKIMGYPIIICLANGKWTEDRPKCKPISCGEPITVQNAKTLYQTPDHELLHHFGSNVTYSCNQGYQLHGSFYLTCVSSGKWVGLQESPRCIEMLCDAPPKLPHAIFLQDDSKKPQVASYTCRHGYEPSGSNTITCHFGKWTLLEMTCDPVNCYEPKIPTNGKLTAKHFMLNSIANYSCNHGYELQGNPTIVCGPSGLWHGQIPQCTPVDCGIPQNPVNGGTNYSSTLFKSVISYTCDEGYELNGDFKRLCSFDGKWSGHLPQCHKISCGELRPPYRGYMIGVGQHYGDIIKFTCEKGYVLEGNDTVICQSDSTWSDFSQTCKKVHCDPPPFIHNGNPPMENEKIYFYGDKISYSCNEGHLPRGDLLSLCQRDGSWSLVKGQCSLVSCGRPTLNGDGSVILGRSFYYKDKIMIKCPSGSKPKGPSSLTCLSDGSWSGQTFCVKGCRRKCINGGMCIRNNVCSCPSGYKGKRCQHALCLMPCLNGGTCIKPYECGCPKGYEGDRCQHPVCEHGCGYSGKCIGANVCLCQFGETGITCPEDEYSNYDYEDQHHATHFNDWDLAYLRRRKSKFGH